MTVEHRLIPDSQLHEPKGVAGASSNTLYHANGLGSGVWKIVDKSSLGISGGAVGDTVVIGNGNTFSTRKDFAFGAMHVVNNTEAYNWDAHPTFGGSDQYRYINGQGVPWTSLTTNTNVLASNGSLTSQVSGLYRYDMDVVFRGLGTRAGNTLIRGGFTLNGAQALHGCNAFFAPASIGSDPILVCSSFKLTAFLQLSSGNYINPAFEPFNAQFTGAIVSSAMVSLTLIRGT